MNYSPGRSIQTGGMLRAWCSPDRTFRRQLLQLDLSCEADARPGILVLANPSHLEASAFEVENLRKELGAILEPLQDDTWVYWIQINEGAERKRMLARLTMSPVFDDSWNEIQRSGRS